MKMITYMEVLQITKTSSRGALEWVDFSTSCINGELSWREKKMTSIFLLAMVWCGFGDEEARRTQVNPRVLELSSPPMKSCKKRVK